MNPPSDPTSGAAETVLPVIGRRSKDYAFKVVPPGLVVKASSIPGAGLGVWTSQCLNKGLVLGPYQGVRVYWEMEAHKSGYCSEVAIKIDFKFQLFSLHFQLPTAALVIIHMCL